MRAKDLANQIIGSVESADADLEAFKQKVAEAYEELMKNRRQLGDEMMESKDKFYDTIAHILDAKHDSGIFEAIDIIGFKAITKEIGGRLGLYEKLKK